MSNEHIKKDLVDHMNKEYGPGTLTPEQQEALLSAYAVAHELLSPDRQVLEFDGATWQIVDNEYGTD